MRKRIILLGLLVSTIMFSLTGCNWSARKFGGTMNVELPEGYKLQEATWKDDELWYLVDTKGNRVASVNPKEKVTIAFDGHQ